MDLLPTHEEDPWGVSGVFEVSYLSGGVLVVKTDGSNIGHFGRGEDRFDNGAGLTAELRMRLLDASPDGFQGAALSVQDGTREAKLSFYNDRIAVRDQNDERAIYTMDTRDDFHIYRLAMRQDRLHVYVDGQLVASVALQNGVSSKAVLLGDLSPEEGENFYAEIDYLAYRVDAALAPDGSPVTPGPTSVPPS